MKHHLTLNQTSQILLGLSLLCTTSKLAAQNAYTINTTVADAFLSGAHPTSNYGGAGTLAIAPSTSAKGEFDSVLMFNTAGAFNQFNTTYGAGNWIITGLTLSLASNAGTVNASPGNAIFNTVTAGNFGIDWISDNAWVEGTGTPQTPSATGVNFNSISTLLSPGCYDSLGTYTYTPPGNNVYVNYSLSLDANLVSEAAVGGDVSLYFYAADNVVGYAFNSKDYTGTPSNHPELTLTVESAPEPTTAALLVASLGGFLFFRRRKK